MSDLERLESEVEQAFRRLISEAFVSTRAPRSSCIDERQRDYIWAKKRYYEAGGTRQFQILEREKPAAPSLALEDGR